MIGCDNDNNIIAFISPNAAVPPSLPISAQRVASLSRTPPHAPPISTSLSSTTPSLHVSSYYHIIISSNCWCS